MSAEEDTELRDLVAQTLEANGTLGKLRAQLRASVFLALEEQESIQNRTPFLNKDLKSFLSTKDGLLVTSLVREFLDFFHLEFTIAVFDPETGLIFLQSQTEELRSRDALAQELNLQGSGGSGEVQVPLLMELLRQSGNHVSSQGSNNSNASEEHDARGSHSLPKDLSEKQIEEARQKFEDYDRDGSGAIDKDELRELFVDMFPSFNKNMLERYVNDELRAVDKDFSGSIDFDEFLGMYKRLFLQCRSVVALNVESILSPTHKTQSSVYSTKSSPMGNSVEVKNQKNLEKSAPPPPLPSTPPPSATSLNGKHTIDDLLGGDEDSFFDDFVPPRGGTIMQPFPNSDDKGHTAGNKKDADTGRKISGDAKGGSGSSMTSLGDLPSFINTGSLTAAPVAKPASGPRGKEGDSTLRSLDAGMVGLDLYNDAQDEFEYEDDFQSSAHSLSQKSPRSKTDGRDKTENGSVAEEIDDEEIEDASTVDDMLKSEHSGIEDMTEDRSISQVDGGFDYMEDPQLP